MGLLPSADRAEAHTLLTKTLRSGLLGHITISKPFRRMEPNPMLQGKWLCIKWPAQSSQPWPIAFPPPAPLPCCLCRKCGPTLFMQNPTVEYLAYLYPHLRYVLLSHSERSGLKKKWFQLREVSKNSSHTCLDFLLSCPPPKQRFIGNPGKAVILIINKWLSTMLTSSSRALLKVNGRARDLY